MSVDLDYRLVLETFADAVVAADGKGAITYVNRAAQALLGWKSDELLGQDLTVLMPERMRPAHRAGFQRFMATHESRIVGRPVRVPAQHRAGHELDIELTLSSIRAPDGELMVASIRDLRDRIELERQVETQRDLLAHYEVVNVLSTSKTFEEAAPALLAAIAQALDWDVGVFWKAGESRGLQARASWERPGLSLGAFMEANLGLSFAIGEGLPGIAWQTRRPYLIADVATDPVLRRGAAAQASGLRSALVLPIFCAEEAHGVMEFWSRARREPREDLLKTMASIGFQIGQFLERLRTEQGLRDNNAALHALMLRAREAERDIAIIADSVPEIVWSTGSGGQSDFFNHRWYEYSGITKGEADIAAYQRIVHPDDLAQMMDKWSASFARGEPFESELRLLRASDQSYRWHLARSVPARDASGAIVKWTGSSTDIDDRKRAEEGMRFLVEAGQVLGASLDYQATAASVARLVVPRLADWCSVHLQEPGDALPRQIAVAHKDPEKVRWANEINQKYPPDPAAPAGVYQVVRTGKPELYSDIADELLVRSAVDAEHLRILRELGMRSVMIVPLTARGATVGALSLISAESRHRYVARDLVLAQELADRVAHAIDNARLYQDAQRAVRLRDEFLAIAGHELKTPLAGLLLQLQSLERLLGKGPPPERIQERVTKATKAGFRLERLIGQLLDVSRIAAGRFQLEPEPLELSGLVREIVAHHAEGAGPGAPPIRVAAEQPIEGYWDRLKLEQVVTNLVGNAVKYGQGLPVDVVLEAAPQSAVLRVIDRGIGIARDQQQRIFERFERAVDNRQYGGFGLGLWIARTIVEASGGQIGVFSEPGKGATFTVTLPMKSSRT